MGRAITTLSDLNEGSQYTICYRAKADEARTIEAHVDSGPEDYRSIMGAAATAMCVVITRPSATFTAQQDDATARLTFNLGASDIDVQLDDIGLYPGAHCGELGSVFTGEAPASSTAPLALSSAAASASTELSKPIFKL